MVSALPPPDRRLPPLGTVLRGRYRLDGYLGAGGMGAVFAATGTSGEQVAVKVLFEAPIGTEGTNALARFVREAQVTSSLASPHLVHVFDGGMDEGTQLAFLVMQRLHGEDIEALVTRVGPLHPITAVRLILQAARGLVVAHAAGVVHRDIKPSNLFLDLAGDRVTVKICDFGLAKTRPSAGEASLTATGSVLGSPLYMAPEQLVSARRVDARADVWSLGMTLYQMLTGAPALHRMKTFAELAIAVTTQEIPHLQDAAPWIDPGLAAVVHGTLLREPDARCPSAQAFADALLPFAANAEMVTPDMLQRVPADLSQTVAPRAAYPLSWDTTGASVPRAEPSAHDPLLGKRLGGKYLVGHVVGRGGMGAVYAATDPAGNSVALKVIHLDHLGAVSQETLGRFVREARSAMSIASPHVVRVLDADTDATYRVPFIVMEMLRGVDLDRMIKDVGPLEPRAAAAIFMQACEGLAAAHDLGIIHRDIKPANIFLHEDETGAITVKICDFGVAKQTGGGDGDQATTELTRTGGIVGSPMYMSPEQARNAKSVDRRSDLFSLSISLHQTLSGKRPWEGCATVGELIVAICTQPVIALQDLAPWIDSSLSEVVHRGLRADPVARWSSARDLAAELSRFALPGPVSRASLSALSKAQRAVIAPRVGGTGRFHSPGATTAVATTMDRPLPARSAPRGSTFLIAIVVSAFVITGSSVALFVRTRPKTPVAAPASGSPSAPVTPSDSPAASASVTRLSVRVPVTPHDAEIKVSGAPRALTDGGELILEGAPGEVFEVVVSRGKTKVTENVILSRDGTATPRSIELAVARPPSTAHPDAIATSARPKDAPPPPPPPTATSTTPKPKDTW